MTKHTPGQWAARITREGHFGGPMRDLTVIEIDGGPRDGHRIVTLTNQPEVAANRRLVESAPDLLAALQAIFPANGPSTHLSDDNIRTATAAIAKATGESQ